MNEKAALIGLNNGTGKGQQYANATVVKENSKTVWVRLADGNIIKRHRTKHGVTIR